MSPKGNEKFKILPKENDITDSSGVVLIVGQLESLEKYVVRRGESETGG